VRVADDVMRRQPLLGERWDYQWGVVALGLQHLWQASGERRYLDYLRRSVDHFIGADGAIATYAMADHSIDHINPGKVLFALYRDTGDERYRRAIEQLREQLRRQPRVAAGGFWHKKIFAHQMWLDGIYMAAPFLAEYAATFGDTGEYDDIGRQITLIYERTRDERTGLLYHGWDSSGTQRWGDDRGRSANFWARGVGWYAMACADVLDVLPAGTEREAIARIFSDTMTAVVRTQDPASGVWWQVLDAPERPGNYLEASASCMFAYALAKGARQGNLPPGHARVARVAYEGIVREFVHVTPAGDVDVEKTCRGAGLGDGPSPTEYRDGSFAYYVSEPIVTNDPKGVGAFILASVELERIA
jgi:unsaturated rhamnogalacturonyl hydrolase